MVTQQDMDDISRRLFNPFILTLDAWTFQYLVLVYYPRRKEFRVWLLVLASFIGFATHLYVHDDHDTMSMTNTVSETCLQLTFIIQITIIGRDVCVKVKLRSIRWLTHIAEALVVLGCLQVLASLLEVAGVRSSGTVHLLGNILETISLVFVLVFRFYYLSLSRGRRRLMTERKLEILLYTCFAIHEFPFMLLEHHTGVTWEFAQGVCNRVVLAACILQNIRKKAVPNGGRSAAFKSKRSSILGSFTSARGPFLKPKANTEEQEPRTTSYSSGTLMKIVPRRSSGQPFPDITKIAVISERNESQPKVTTSGDEK